ncbi:MAG: NfeD family protein [Bacteroides sp.]|nr:NfeD family protein [Bacillota bacterium]MCM1393282.1 NfeD family protein [[Eubacterium] siraeum]MCM1455415.1 NfeD family protein [Bacteroides sp.]
MESIMVWIWLAVTIIAIVVELITPELVSIWFAVGGIIGIIFSFIPGLPWWGEVIIFAIVSMALLFAVRPVVKKYFGNKRVATNTDRIIGKEVRMLSRADFDNLGSAKIGDVVWSVKSENETPLLADEIVQIVAVDGNKLIARHVADVGSLSDKADEATADIEG